MHNKWPFTGVTGAVEVEVPAADWENGALGWAPEFLGMRTSTGFEALDAGALEDPEQDDDQ